MSVHQFPGRWQIDVAGNVRAEVARRQATQTDIATVLGENQAGRALHNLRFAYTQYLDAMTEAHEWGDLHDFRRARYLRDLAESLAYVLAGWWTGGSGIEHGDRPAVLPNRSR